MMTKKEYAIMQAIPEKLIEEVCHFPDHEGRWHVLAMKWWKHMQRLFPALSFHDFMEIAWWKWAPKKIKVKRITCVNCGDSFAEGYCWETGGNCERYEEEIEVYDTVKVFGGGEKEYFSDESDY
jgi:flavodoxin